MGKNTNHLSYINNLASAKAAVCTALTNSRSPMITTKFSEDSGVLLQMVCEIHPEIPVIWVDTGYNTRATLAYAKTLTERLNLSLHTYRPHNHKIIIPPALDSPEHAEFTYQVKLEPFKRALAELNPDTWLSSIRRYQSDYRNTLTVFDQLNDGMLKVSPLLGWSADCVRQYSLDNRIPSGPLCYDPTKGEPFRGCGLHLVQ